MCMLVGVYSFDRFVGNWGNLCLALLTAGPISWASVGNERMNLGIPLGNYKFLACFLVF